MRSIPSAIGGDAEDVVWALQTADALWRRRERLDAIVWLRRAAQAAGEAEDDDRALQLARDAAELAEWLARNPSAGLSVAPRPRTTPPPAVNNDVDDLLSAPAAQDGLEDATLVQSIESVAGLARATGVVATPPAARVPSAAEVHAGMLDPWADTEGLKKARPPKDASHAKEAEDADARTDDSFDDDEVVTSAPMVAADPAPTTRPPAARRPSPPPPPREIPRSPPPPPRKGPGDSPPEQAPKVAVNDVDLSNVEALSDLPDDARFEFANAATVQTLNRDDEVSGFALALVLEGSVDLSATIVDAAALRLEAGAVIRARGTVDAIAPMRLVGASDRSRVATWNDQEVRDAFRTCPWVEDELRAAGDRHQALVGITMGPLGERLDSSLRAQVVSRLRIRTLSEHEVIATSGEPVPGLVLVGAGELEVVGDEGTPTGAVIRPGEFVFPSETLRAARSPNTVRAGRGGALVLTADRGVAQELLMTFPPLLEIFAGM